MASPPANAYPPGTVLTVGSHKAMIVKYISEGGFAHVYLVKISPFENGQEIACLKRVLVPNKAFLNILRAEVDAMKRLQGRPYIVTYIDSHAARSPSNDGTYEVFLLMEYCSKNGLINFLNSRLKNRLTEAEVLQIMYEVTIAVSQVHFLNPPLIHRDIKIENILINDNNEYRLCDFGSSCPPLRPPRNQQEYQVLQNDILHYTTAQYRSPEMIDLNRGLPIDEKSDIWAMGVFCYKICYYTTPFEQTGEPAILQSNFSFPSFPVYSPRLQNLIKVLLTNDARARPDVYQVLEEVCRMKNVPVPFDVQQQYKIYKQQKQQQQQQQIFAQQKYLQQQQQAAAAASSSSSSSAAPVSLAPAHVQGIAGQLSGSKLYGDPLVASTSSIKSVKSGKSGHSVQSAVSSQSSKSNGATGNLIFNNTSGPVSATVAGVHPLLSANTTFATQQASQKTNSLPALSKSTDPFADIVAPIKKKPDSTTKASLASLAAASKQTNPIKPSTNSTTTSQPAPHVTPFKPLLNQEPLKPKRNSMLNVKKTSPKDDLSLEVIDIDLHGIKNNNMKPTVPEQTSIQSDNTKATKSDMGNSKIDDTKMAPQLTAGELRRSQSFHKRTISAGKTGLNKLTSSFTGKFRSSSGNSSRPTNRSSVDMNRYTRTPSPDSSDLDKSEDELISEISMNEFKDVDYLKKNSLTSVQKRMSMLMSSKDEVVKTATGYGKYTDDLSHPTRLNGTKQSRTIPEISLKVSSFTKPITSKRNSLDFSKDMKGLKIFSSSSSSLPSEKFKPKAKPASMPATRSTTPAPAKSGKVKPPVPKKEKKIPPPRPKKPIHLVSPKIDKTDQWLSQEMKLSPSKQRAKTTRKSELDEDKQENAFFVDDGVVEDDGFDVNDFEKSFNEKFPKLI